MLELIQPQCKSYKQLFQLRIDSRTKINSKYKNQTLKNVIKSSLTNANSNWGVHTIEPNKH